MLMALAIAFQSKKHGDYKLKAFPNMFYRVLGSLFRKFFFSNRYWRRSFRLVTGYRESGCESQIMWVSSISPSCHQQLKLVTNIWFRHFLTIDFKSKFRESTVRVYAETYSPKRTRVSISKIFLRKIKKKRVSFSFIDFCWLRLHYQKKWFQKIFLSFLHFLQKPKNEFLIERFGIISLRVPVR